MGLASKLAAAGAAPGAGAPPYTSGAAPGAGGGAYAQPPKPAGYPQVGAPSTQTPMQGSGFPSAPQQGGYPPQQGQQGGYGAPPQQGQQGGYPPQQGQPGGQLPSAYPAQQSNAFGAPQQQQQYGQQGAQGASGGYGAPPQQGAYGAAPTPAGQGAFGAPQGAPAAGNAGLQQGLRTKLEQIIAVNQLQHFYPPPALQALLNRLNNVDFRQLAARWNMPMELATSLAAVALYDIVIYADDSGSMIFEENGERINDLKLILGRVSEVATLFDDDGIVVRFMNSSTEGNGIRDAAAASALVQQVQFNGLTPLGTNLNTKIIQPMLGAGVNGRNLAKPILVIAITDGEPAGEPSTTILNVIKGAKQMCANSQYGPGAIAFEFAQVGKDQKAQAFLGMLDNDPVIGKMVDATSYYELEADEYARKGVNLTPDLWLVKLMVGAIDPTFDEQD